MAIGDVRDLPAPRRLRARAWSASQIGVLCYLAVLVGLSALVGISYRAAPFATYLHGPAWLAGWFHRDSGWYYRIVTEGYSYHPGHQSSIAFFPSYPLIVRGVDTVVGDPQVSGTVVAVVAGLICAQQFGAWAEQRLPARTAVIAVLLLLLYPFSFYLYGPMYSDSVFLLSALLAFAAVERGRFLLAGVIGVVATAGRPVGLAVTIGLVIRALEVVADRVAAARLAAVQIEAAGIEENGSHADALQPGRARSARATLELLALAPRRDVLTAVAGSACSVLGLLTWCIYLHVRFHDALAWVHVEAAWGQASGPRTWFKAQFFYTELYGPQDLRILLLAQAACCLLGVLLLVRVRRLFGWGYAAYSTSILLIAMVGTKDLMGTGRYIIAAFPILAAAATVLTGPAERRIWLPRAALALSAAGLAVATSFYAHGYAVS